MLFDLKKLVQQHGGTIEIFSGGLGLGCVTIVELPMYTHYTPTKSNNNPTTPIESPILPKIASPNKKLRRCLVVDDSLPNRKMLVRLLERAGHMFIRNEWSGGGRNNGRRLFKAQQQ